MKNNLNLNKKLNTPAVNPKLKSLAEMNFSDKEMETYNHLLEKIKEINNELTFSLFIDNTFNNKSLDTKFIVTELMDELIKKTMSMDSSHIYSEEKQSLFIPLFEKIPKQYVFEDTVIKVLKDKLPRFIRLPKYVKEFDSVSDFYNKYLDETKGVLLDYLNKDLKNYTFDEFRKDLKLSHPHLLEWFSRWYFSYSTLLNDENIALKAIYLSDFNSDIPNSIKDNDQFIEKLLAKNINNIRFIQSNKRTPELCKLAFEKSNKNFEEIRRRDPNIAYYATELSKDNNIKWDKEDNYFYSNRLKTIIKKLPDEFMTYEILENCINTGSKIDFDPFKEYWKDTHLSTLMTEDLCYKMLENFAPRYSRPRKLPIPERLLENKAFVEKLASNFPGIIKKLAPKYRTKNVSILAVKLDWKSLEYIQERFKTKELCWAAIMKYPNAIEYVPKEIIDDDMIIYAMEKDVEITDKMNFTIPQYILDDPSKIPLLIKSKNKYRKVSILPDNIKNNLSSEIIDAYIYDGRSVSDLIWNVNYTKNITKEQWFRIFYQNYWRINTAKVTSDSVLNNLTIDEKMEILSTNLSICREWRGREFFLSIFSKSLSNIDVNDTKAQLRLTDKDDIETLKKIVFWQFTKKLLNPEGYEFLEHSYNFHRKDKSPRKEYEVIQEVVKNARENYFEAISKWLIDWNKYPYISIIWFLNKYLSLNKTLTIEAIKVFLDNSSLSREMDQPLKRKEIITNVLKSDEFKNIWNSLLKKAIIDKLFWKDALKETLTINQEYVS